MNIQYLKAKSREMKANLGVLYLVFKHNRTPWYAKALIGIVISYALSPIDLIPDFIPILGYLDDLILVPGGIALAIKLIPDDVIAECREKQKIQPAFKMNGIYAGIVIIAIWLILLYLIVKQI
ncbi:MAG: hypothetical protein CVU90_03500 [Firmicutes bacterium HGW-Firmicutes-15]|nr:MAG: hypothetical protein CVU90_03500 [Firmicutes bacterium HGW-Firmicutes-15]